MGEHLESWNDTPARAAIVDFVERVTTEGGSDFVPPSERIATFDLVRGVGEAFGGQTTEEFQAEAVGFFESVRHPPLGVVYTEAVYKPRRAEREFAYTAGAERALAAAAARG